MRSSPKPLLPTGRPFVTHLCSVAHWLKTAAQEWDNSLRSSTWTGNVLRANHRKGTCFSWVKSLRLSPLNMHDAFSDGSMEKLFSSNVTPMDVRKKACCAQFCLANVSGGTFFSLPFTAWDTQATLGNARALTYVDFCCCGFISQSFANVRLPFTWVFWLTWSQGQPKRCWRSNNGSIFLSSWFPMLHLLWLT